MGKYYVAGVPFDSENSLKHYGVKGMEWNKHKFGIDADDRYIKWLKNAGQNIGRFANNAAQNVAKGATTAAKTVGSAVNKGANFVTGNQNRQQYQNQSSAARMMRNPQQAQQRATNYYNQQQAKTLPGIAKTATSSVANTADKLYRESGLKGNVDRVSNAITGNIDRATAQSYRDLANFQEDQNAPFHAESPKYSPENLRKEADEYQKAADNALIPSVQRAAGNVENAVGQAAGNVGNAVGDWAKGAAQKAADIALWPATREDVANAAQNVSEFITGRNANENLERLYAENIANGGNGMSPELTEARNRYNQTLPGMAEWAQDNLRENVAPEIEERVQNVGNAISGAANKAAEGAKGFINSAGKWVSNAAGNVGKAAQNVGSAASKAASDASKGASGFINSAGKWVSNAAGNVGKAAQDAGKAVSNAAQDVGNTVGQAAEQARGGIGGLFDRVGNAVGSAANAVGDWAGQAVQDVGGAVQNAGNWIGDRAQDVGGAVSGAAQNAGNAVSGAADWARNVANNVGQTVGNFVDQNITGNSDRAKANWYGQLSDQAPGKYNTDYWSKKQYEANNRAGRTLFGTAEGLGKSAQTVGQNVGQAVGDFVDRNITGNTMRNEANRLQSVVDGYDRGEEKPNGYYYVGGRDQAVADQQLAEKMANDSLFGRIGNAAGNVGNWASQAAQNVGNAAGNVADWARNAAGNVGNWAGQAAQGVGQFLNDIETARLQPKIQAATQRMADNYIQYLQDHPENPASPRHAEWAQRQQTQLIEQLRNDPELRAYYEQYIRHSAIDEKPDGVSDAFWEKFTADGGTREEYERDWR